MKEIVLTIGGVLFVSGFLKIFFDLLFLAQRIANGIHPLY
jgi:hypothetical protein